MYRSNSSFDGSDFIGPVNIGSEEMVTINQLVDTAAKVAGKVVDKNILWIPFGVRGRNSNNDVVRERTWLGLFTCPLRRAFAKTYDWIKEQIKNK
jgi:GDP-D-mannose 3', 5'-epimerase